MSYTIAMAGKGGTGKTTIAGLLIKYMIERGKAEKNSDKGQKAKN